MNYELIHRGDLRYLDALPHGSQIQGEQDALDWVGACGETGTNLPMLHAGNLPEAFFDLSSGVAGAILLKFSNYRIQVAAVLTPGLVGQGKFYEMVLEANRGSDFRVFFDLEKAEAWFLSQGTQENRRWFT